MTKKILIFSVFLCIHTSLKAQQDTLFKRQNGLAFTIGLVRSTITNPHVPIFPSLKHLTGYAVGLCYSRYFGNQNQFSVTSEASVIKCGTQYHIMVTDAFGNTINPNALMKKPFMYFRFSELFRTSILKNHINLGIGPYTGLLLKSKSVINDPALEHISTKLYEQFDIGAIGAIGYAHVLNPSWVLSTEVRGWLGIKHINPANPAIEFFRSRHVSYSFQLTLEKRF